MNDTPIEYGRLAIFYIKIYFMYGTGIDVLIDRKFSCAWNVITNYVFLYLSHNFNYFK